jgi:uncharacterized protein YdbL (DUF1318 family)
MRIIARVVAAFVLALAVAFGAALPAAADALDDARAAGLVGERPDGYVGLVDSGAPTNIRALVDQINAARRQAYQQIAQETGATVEQVGMLTAQKLYNQVPAGTYLLDQNGQWVQK